MTPQTPPAINYPEKPAAEEDFSAEMENRRSKSPFSSFRSSFSRKLSLRKKKPKAATPVVDIQPWNERRGNSRDDPFESSSPKSPRSPKSPPPALMPKRNFEEEAIPKHRMFTTPGIFRGSKGELADDHIKVSKASKYDLLYSTATVKPNNVVNTTQSLPSTTVSSTEQKKEIICAGKEWK